MDEVELTNESEPGKRAFVSSNEVYVAGYRGTFLKYDGERWEDLSNPKLKLYFSGLEIFDGMPYLAAEEGIFCFDGKEITLVDTELKPVPDGQSLHANDGVLWSFGLEHLCYFDGRKWTYVKHPDDP